MGVTRYCERHRRRLRAQLSRGERELAVVVLDGLRIESDSEVLVDKPLHAKVVAGEVERVLLDARVRLEPLDQAEGRERRVRYIEVAQQVAAHLHRLRVQNTADHLVPGREAARPRAGDADSV